MRMNGQGQRLSGIDGAWRCRLTALTLVAAAFLLAAVPCVGALAQDAAAPQAAPPAAAAAPSQAQPAPAAGAPPAGAPNAAAPAPQQPAANSAAPQPDANAGAAVPDAAAGANANPPPAPAPSQPAIGGELLPHRLSLVGMYLDADAVVKAVMIGLAFASLVTWTVFLAKSLELYGARRDVRKGLRVLGSVTTFAEAHDVLRQSKSPVAQALQAAGEEVRLSMRGPGDSMKERIALQLERLEMAAGRKISRGTGVLATIGSTAPFVGLFGTVWGIMNSFIGISNANTTNLAVVAPGIAQALLATAMGLIAAIPAVMIYNVLARQTAHYRALVGDASAQVMRLVSRDLDRARLPLAHAAE
jgi:biopolymer transport protein ExbB